MLNFLLHVVKSLLYLYNPCLDISTIDFDIPIVDKIGSDYLIISIFGYYFGDLWGLKGIYTILVVLYVMSTAQSNTNTISGDGLVHLNITHVLGHRQFFHCIWGFFDIIFNECVVVYVIVKRNVKHIVNNEELNNYYPSNC